MLQEEETKYNPWLLIGSYFKGQHLERLVRHQLESYNNFINFQIMRTIQMFNPIHVASEHDFDPVSKKYALEIFMSLENFSMHRPQIQENNGAIKLMMPNEARLRNFTYACPTLIDLHIQYIIRSGPDLENVHTINKVIPKVHLGKLPIMLKSDICVLKQYKHFDSQITGECPFDMGGYFIINGSEKIVLGQERSAENKVYCFDLRKNSTKYLWSCEMRSVSCLKCISPKQISMYLLNNDNGFGHGIHIQIPRVKSPIPLFILFRALGVANDKAICEIILLDIMHKLNIPLLNELQASIMEASICQTQEECVKYIAYYVMYTPFNMDKEMGVRKKEEFVNDVLDNDLFPHCHNKTQKIYFLGYMTKHLLMCHFGLISPTDRDSYVNKRVDMCGSSMNNLYRNYLNKTVKDMEKQTIREINNGSWKSSQNYENIINPSNIYKIVKSSTIENGVKRALSTGDFSIKNGNSNKIGVAQVLNRLNYPSSLSHVRRVSAPIDKSGKNILPRKLHPTSWGFFCQAETPEGHSVGVVKNSSYMSMTTVYSDLQPLVDNVMIDVIPLSEFDSQRWSKYVKVFINGAWMGVTDKPYELFLILKDKKHRGVINIYTSIVFHFHLGEIRVCNDSGRLCRPLLRVNSENRLILSMSDQQRLQSGELKWDDLLTNCRLNEAVIEYIDADESEFTQIANSPQQVQLASHQYTHCEIHPSTCFGILASCTPFPEHNQSPRNTYQCAQGKQAMGIYMTNHENRMDKTAYILNYPTRPLVDTRIMDMLHLNKLPCGTNLIVAIMSHSGYNQEDSILINQGAIDRGMALVTVYHIEKDEDKQKRNGESEIRAKPDKTKTKGMKLANYDKLDARGIVSDDAFIENRDIIIGKFNYIKENKNDPTKTIKYEDLSRMVKTTEDTYVNNTVVGRNGEGYNFAKVKLRSLRKPVIGDKFSSRHGQKGTVGNIIPECDMPFTEDGLRPDIIINPHAIPSRMTIGQLKETLLGLVLLQLGLFGDGTAFGDLHVYDICEMLHKLGFQSNGDQLMYNGLTGEQMQSSVFIGPVYYQRLKHMVNDKVHSRASGPKVTLTRQPAEGRSKDGGLRFGEMERDCMGAHGATRFMQERMYDVSDKYEVFTCRECGMIVAYNDAIHIHKCLSCDNTTNFAFVKIPYACKLLFQELATMNIIPRMITER